MSPTTVRRRPAGTPGARTATDSLAADPAGGVLPPAGIGTFLVTSAGIAFVLICTGVTTGLLLHGQGWPSSLAIGTFTGFWGGAGFGVMVGGVLHTTREQLAGP